MHDHAEPLLDRDHRAQGMGKHRAASIHQSGRHRRHGSARARRGCKRKESIFGIPIEPEKEILFTLVPESDVETVLQEIIRAAELNLPGHGLAFVVPVTRVLGVPHMPD